MGARTLNTYLPDTICRYYVINTYRHCTCMRKWTRRSRVTTRAAVWRRKKNQENTSSSDLVMTFSRYRPRLHDRQVGFACFRVKWKKNVLFYVLLYLNSTYPKTFTRQGVEHGSFFVLTTSVVIGMNDRFSVVNQKSHQKPDAILIKKSRKISSKRKK